jgi:hypothetical protein
MEISENTYMKQAGKLPRLYVPTGPLGAQGASNIHRLHEVPSPSFLTVERSCQPKEADLACVLYLLSICGFPSEAPLWSRALATRRDSKEPAKKYNLQAEFTLDLTSG